MDPHPSITDPTPFRGGPQGRVLLTTCLLVLAAASLSIAINIREGLFCQGAINWLTVAVLACAAALFQFSIRAGAWQRHLPILILLLALAFQFFQLYTRYPGSLWNTPPGSTRHQLSIAKDDFTWITEPAKRQAAKARITEVESSLKDWRFQLGILLAAGLSVIALLRPPWLRHSAFALILLIHFLLGASLLQRTAKPFIDVYVFQQESAATLLRGDNPYATTFTNIYGPNAYVYAADLMKDGRVNFGYPYPPLSLFMTLPGYVIAGDSRYSQLAAISLAAALIACARPGIASILAALLLLFTPRVFNVVELAWTEPFVVLLLAGTLFCAVRFPRLTPYALGLLVASKQYMIFAIPLAALLLPRPFCWKDYIRMMVKAAVGAAAVSLPLVLWNPPAFWRSAVTLQLVQPFRPDSISYLAWLSWYWPPAVVAKFSFLAFVAATAMIVLALRRFSPTPASFALALSVTYLAFLALNKQAFCNYYVLVIAALCCTIALLPDRRQPRPLPS